MVPAPMTWAVKPLLHEIPGRIVPIDVAILPARPIPLDLPTDAGMVSSDTPADLS